MVNNVIPALPAVGGCLRCNQLFMVIDLGSRCQFCGRPPDRLLPFGPVEAVEEEVELEQPPPAEVPEELPPYESICPHCGAALELRVTDTEILITAPISAPPADETGPDLAPSPEPVSEPVPEGVVDRMIQEATEAGYPPVAPAPDASPTEEPPA